LAIRVQEGARLPKAKQRRFTRDEALEIKKQLEELLKKGKVRESRSESAVGTLFVLKHDGSKRWCMDMRPINAITPGDENKAPLQDIARERIQGATVFTRLDLRDGYHHLRIREGDEKYTAFITEYGLYEWTVACFGLKNAPAEFARYMSNILREFVNDFVVVYFDDIIIYSNNLEEHWRQVRKVLGKLKEPR
jgi:Reverse transcriptase (RNA-dependent DNA polymerase)